MEKEDISKLSNVVSSVSSCDLESLLESESEHLSECSSTVIVKSSPPKTFRRRLRRYADFDHEKFHSNNENTSNANNSRDTKDLRSITSSCSGEKLCLSRCSPSKNDSNDESMASLLSSNPSANLLTSSTVVATVECGICMEAISEVGEMDSCSHKFCFTCIFEWSKVTNLCPFCKAEFRTLRRRALGTNTTEKSRRRKQRDSSSMERIYHITPKKQKVVSSDEDWSEEDEEDGIPLFMPFLNTYDLCNSFIDNSMDVLLDTDEEFVLENSEEIDDEEEEQTEDEEELTDLEEESSDGGEAYKPPLTNAFSSIGRRTRSKCTIPSENHKESSSKKKTFQKRKNASEKSHPSKGEQSLKNSISPRKTRSLRRMEQKQCEEPRRSLRHVTELASERKLQSNELLELDLSPVGSSTRNSTLNANNTHSIDNGNGNDDTSTDIAAISSFHSSAADVIFVPETPPRKKQSTLVVIGTDTDEHEQTDFSSKSPSISSSPLTSMRTRTTTISNRHKEASSSSSSDLKCRLLPELEDHSSSGKAMKPLRKNLSFSSSSTTTTTTSSSSSSFSHISLTSESNIEMSSASNWCSAIRKSHSNVYESVTMNEEMLDKENSITENDIKRSWKAFDLLMRKAKKSKDAANIKKRSSPSTNANSYPWLSHRKNACL